MHCKQVQRVDLDCAINACQAGCYQDDTMASTPVMLFSTALQASEVRQQWRVKQGAITIALDESEVRISDSLLLDPEVTIERLNVSKSPSRSMVAEMMILAGQVAATIGEFRPCSYLQYKELKVGVHL